MTFPQKIALLLIVFGVLAFLFRHWQTSSKPTVRHLAPRSKRPDDSYQATNTTAKLLTEVLGLRERRAQWPEILKTLNPSDEPHVRTILLELRWPHIANPDEVLKVIEDVCLSVNLSGQTPSRVEILELTRIRIGGIGHHRS
jgi:hypothetical protein